METVDRKGRRLPGERSNFEHRILFIWDLEGKIDEGFNRWWRTAGGRQKTYSVHNSVAMKQAKQAYCIWMGEKYQNWNSGRKKKWL